jgi:predicted aldo/keto reductase-like oxidoreductase
MEACMLAAARLGWIDGIMMSYNYRLMGKDKMKKAVDACVETGIGLTAMKTLAAFSANFYASIGSETDAALKMTEKLIQKGYTAEQAKLKAVWENPNIASICSAMPNMTILQANIAAALNKTDLSKGDMCRLQEYAMQTAPGYCSGCGDICESVIAPDIPVCDIMRYCMYAYGYGDRATAMNLLNQLPTEVKDNLIAADYTAAEQCCPQKIPIGTIMKTVKANLI